MTLADLARDLRAEATRANERRLLVLAGDAGATREAALDALDAADVDLADATAVSDREGWPMERVAVRRSAELLGATRSAVVLDAHGACPPNAIGRTVGAVDGGGLYLILAPPLDDWHDRRDGFDESLAVPPAGVDDVTGHFRRRLVETLREHPGVAVVNVGDGTSEPTIGTDGLTHPPPARPAEDPTVPDEARFPSATYEACLTPDQAEAVHALEALAGEDRAVVIEADRGRGKSSAAGLAAGALAREGRDVLVTAPEFRSAAEVFARARESLAGSGDYDREGSDGEARDDRRLVADSGGEVRFASPTEAAELVGGAGAGTGDSRGRPDAVVVDEAAALPVHILSRFLEAPAVAFCTTVHGYEGAGRGFDVRFRDRLQASAHEVTDVHLDDPIRYAAGDPVETWAFRALLLDARPAVDQVVADATPDSVEYRPLEPADLLADEHLLREAFGLLVLAHYRTEPDDLARLLDAPNLTCRALVHDGHVASVALLAREGDLDRETRHGMYEGARVRGNMIPDVLTSQLRDEDAGVPVGYRVMRIATHHGVRSRGLGSRLLEEVEGEVGDDVDWLGAGFGATPGLVDFWRENGYRTVHLATTRNATSGEYSVVMLRPTGPAGRSLHDRHARWFRERAAGVLADPLSDADPHVVRVALRSMDPDAALRNEPSLSERDWRVVAAAAYGPGMYVTAPEAVRTLAVHSLVRGDVDDDRLDPRAERLLVAKVLQCRPWDAVTEDLGFVSTRTAMQALGRALQPLVDAYGPTAAQEEAERYTDDG